jgi:hypothetical protein
MIGGGGALLRQRNVTIVVFVTMYYYLTCYMFRSYDHLQAEIYLLGLTRLTTDSNRLRAGRQRGWSSSPGRVKNFYFSISRPALWPAQSPIQWIAAGLFPQVRPEPEADHLQLLPRSMKRGSIHPLSSYVFME